MTDGETNASLRAGDTIETITPVRAVELIQARRARGRLQARREAGGPKEDLNGSKHFCRVCVHNLETSGRNGLAYARVRMGGTLAATLPPGERVATAGLDSAVQKRKDIDSELTQSQLTELLETESARSLIEAGEERGWIEPAELEAFAVENDLDDAGQETW